MFEKTGIRGHKTNHSLRATGAIDTAGLPEKIIQEQTGHGFVEALHMYESTSTDQHQAVAALQLQSSYHLMTVSDLSPSLIKTNK